MHHIVRVLESCCERGCPEQVGFDGIDGKAFQPSQTVSLRPKEASHVVPLLQQSFDRVAPDESGSPGDGDSGDSDPPWFWLLIDFGNLLEYI